LSAVPGLVNRNESGEWELIVGCTPPGTALTKVWDWSEDWPSKCDGIRPTRWPPPSSGSSGVPQAGSAVGPAALGRSDECHTQVGGRGCGVVVS